MASDNEASCENDPNFAVICAFLEKFGAQCGLPSVDFLQLQKMLENSEEVPPHLLELILKLLRRVKKSLKNDKWEKALVSVCHKFSSQDAWEIERFGYKKAKISSKIRAIKELLEMQFDHLVKFKNDINKLTAEQLRSQPLGRDKAGHAYWFHSDDNYQIRVYKEDLDEETWSLIAKDRESLVSLITKLNDGEYKSSSESAANEDSNSLSEKPVIDTGQDEIDLKTKDSEESENDVKETPDSEDVTQVKLSSEDTKTENIAQTDEVNKQSTNSSDENNSDNSEDSKEEDSIEGQPKPTLRIKNLSELMGSSTKRPRFDSDDEPQGKVLKIKLKNLNSEPIVGPEIEEPVMKISGEGLGEENECAYRNLINISEDPSNLSPSEENPIIGEAIEEEVVYFFGEGCGEECQTGNDERASTSETHSKSEIVTENNADSRCSNSSSSTGSIKVNLSDFKDNNDQAKEAPSIKLGTVFDSKTDNNPARLSSSPSRKSRWDVETLEDQIAEDEALDCTSVAAGKVKSLVHRFEQAASPTQDKSPPDTPKKSNFFFGSATLKSSCVPPLLTFGENSPKRDVVNDKSNKVEVEVGCKPIGKTGEEPLCDVSATSEDNTHSNGSEKMEDLEQTNKIESTQCDEKEKEATKVSINEGDISSKTVLKSPEGNVGVNITTNSSSNKETDLEKVSNIIHNAKNEPQNTKIIVDKPDVQESMPENAKRPKEKSPEIDVDQTVKDVAKNGTVEQADDKNDKEEPLPVVEPEFVKKTAYICGEEGSDNDKNDKIENQESGETSDKEEDTEENRTDKEMLVKEGEAKPADNDEKLNKEVSKKNETSDAAEEKITQSLVKQSEEPTANDRTETNKSDAAKENENKTDVKPQVSLRSIRSKKTSNLNKDSDFQKAFLSTVLQKEPDKAAPEVQPPRKKGRPRKQKEDTPPSEASQEATKKPKLVAPEPDEEEEETISTRSGRRSIRGKIASKAKENQTKNGEVVSVESSSVDSPASTEGSIILVADSVENSVDALEKDPLADSDDGTPSTPSQKPINLQSFSLDYNESSTPPPIPVIPTRTPLRKRGREASPELKEVQVTGKRMKMKGKRQIDTNLRKSVEKKKEEQVGSSSSSGDEVHDDVSDEEEEGESTAKSPKKKVGKAKNLKKERVIEISDEDSGTPVPKPKKRPSMKNSRLLANLGINSDEPVESTGRHLRQSRRIAQIKIKEQAEGKKPDPTPIKDEKAKKIKKENSVEKSKKVKVKYVREETPEPELEPELEPERDRKRKKKFKSPSKIFDEHRPWKSSSESSEGEEEEVEEEEEAIEEEEPALEFKSDHEFSPESDLEEGEEVLPLKRARTARKWYGEESDEDDESDDRPCQKCGKSDHPEWVLLCDKCNNGWHCSCLRPPLLVIPEGDWFCPPCEHLLLVKKLEQKLVEYDKKLSKKEIEDRRKERLAYVGISLNNVLPSREHEHRKKKRRHSEHGTESSSEGSEQSSEYESETDSDEPIYQLRQRRQARSYKFNEYDDLIKSAIQEEIEEKNQEIATQSHGKDIATIVRAEQEDRKEKGEVAENIESEPTKPEEKELPAQPPVVTEEKNDDSDGAIKPSVNKAKKKRRKINNLDISSEEDDEKDEDFKGTSSESEDEEEEEEEEDSDEDSEDQLRGGKRRKSMRPVRRSTRARVSRYDADFINDSDYDDTPRKKKKKRYWSESESEESDKSWGRRKRRGKSNIISKKKSKKKSILDELSDIEPLKKKKPKIKYGGLTSSDEDMGRGRRTRGKKTTYVDTLGSDSEEENRRNKNPRRIESDDDEDFVANDDDEKDSEEGHEEVEDEQDDSSLDRRPLVVPKIYIKKPPVSREMDRTKERPNLQTDKVATDESSKEVASKVAEEKPKLTDETSANQSEGVRGDTEEKSEKVGDKPVFEAEKRNSEEVVKSLEDEKRVATRNPQKSSTQSTRLDEVDDNEDSNLMDDLSRDMEDVNSDEMEKMMEEEEYANKQLQLVALQIEREKRRKAGEVARKLEPEKMAIPSKRGRKPAMMMPVDATRTVMHEPIVSNVRALIRNDDSNDELSEPPGVALPMFEELGMRKSEEEAPKKRRGRGKGKKTLEETLATLEGKKREKTQSKPQSEAVPQGCNIEIAAPPQPFSQSSPTPSVITRMLQTKPGQTTTYPVGTIRPKQFATMPDDDDDSPSRSRGASPSTGNMGLPPPGQFMPGGPRGPVGGMFRSIHSGMNHYPRGVMPPHQMRGPAPTGMPPHLYHPHRPHDPSPSGGGPVNMSDPNANPVVPSPTSSPGNKGEPQNYSRPPPSNRYPPSPSIPMTPPRPMHMLGHMQQSRPSNLSPYPPSDTPPNYYGVYPADSIANEDAMPPTAYQNSPYPEQFSGEMAAEPSEHSSKSYGGEESGGEFGGLVSYFSSQREDDLES